jgi:hypothetical protein
MSLQFIARKGRSLNAQKIVEVKGKNKRKFVQVQASNQVSFWFMDTAGNQAEGRSTLTESDSPELDCFQALGIKAGD